MPPKSLKEKTISGFTWSFTDNFANLGIQFIIGIILARLLSPREFGLIGMIAVFIAISQSFIDCGFRDSLIRKKDCTQNDYSTIFYFNLTVSLVFYLLLFFLAKPISSFFNEPRLIDIIRIIGLGLIINSFSIIQDTILVKRIDFKLQTKISIISSILSGIVGVYMAYAGFGVWSLVWRTIAAYFIRTLLLWMWNHWYPAKIFNYNALKEHFKFGYKLLFSGLINTLYINAYYLIIGKFFSAANLGYYTRAENFAKLPSVNITNVVQRVSYPVLSSIQDNSQKLKEGYRKLIKSTMLISFVLMFGLSATAKPLVLTLIGEKWLPAVPYLQLLCFSSVLYPLHSLNLNMLNVHGRSDLFLRLEIIKKILAIPVIFIAIFLGIKAMLIGMIFNSIIAYLLNSYWSGKMVNYPMKEQIMDILPSLFLATFMGIVIAILGYFLNAKPLLILLVQISVGALIIVGIAGFLKLDAYMEIRDILIGKVFKNSQV